MRLSDQRHRSFAGPAVLALAPATSSWSQSASPSTNELSADEPANTGQDDTNPVNRIDIRGDWIQGANCSDAQLMILRHDRPSNLGNGGKSSSRIDLPFVINDQFAPYKWKFESRVGFYFQGGT